MKIYYRHKKRGSIYEVLTQGARLQCSASPEFERMFDIDDWTVYRDIITNKVYLRPTFEFMDGRFEKLEG